LKKLLALIVVLAAALSAWFYLKRSNDPAVSFAKATREKISNVLSTNGKVEPAEYVDVRVESSGLVKRLGRERGQHDISGHRHCQTRLLRGVHAVLLRNGTPVRGSPVATRHSPILQRSEVPTRYNPPEPATTRSRT